MTAKKSPNLNIKTLSQLLTKQNEYLLIQIEDKLNQRFSETNALIFRTRDELREELGQKIDSLESRTKAGFDRTQERFDEIESTFSLAPNL